MFFHSKIPRFTAIKGKGKTCFYAALYDSSPDRIAVEALWLYSNSVQPFTFKSFP